MKNRKFLKIVVGLFLAYSLLRGLSASPLANLFKDPAALEPAVYAPATDAARKNADATVVELFTSQGCSSCPPAQEYLRALALRPDVLTLEHHVDYWNDLKTWRGAWQDPYSSAAATGRQVAYNQRLYKSDKVYTPQIIIDGLYESIGSKRNAVEDLINKAQGMKDKNISLTAEMGADGKLSVTVEGKTAGDLVFVRLLKYTRTKIKSGENSGDDLSSFNVVKEFQRIGAWKESAGKYISQQTPLAEGEACAVLLQNPDNLRIIAARFCQNLR